MSAPLRFVVLGDSAAAGIGDSDKFGNNFGWGYYLARCIQSPLVYANVSRPGAQNMPLSSSPIGLQLLLVELMLCETDFHHSAFIKIFVRLFRN